MANRDIVVIGSSAGGVEALVELVKNLPPNLDASIFIVQHVAPNAPSVLPQILTRAGYYKAIHPQDGQAIEKGKIYIAPPNHHLLLEYDRILVKKGPKENRFRPSVDALFRSAAYVYKTRVIGLVLSGMLDDGTSGMWAIKHLGGISIIQDPEDAKFSSMPNNVTEYVDVDHVLPVAKMGILLEKLVNEPAPGVLDIESEERKRFEAEIKIAAQQNSFEMGILHMGKPTFLTCPECHGSLVQIKEGDITRYRCHTGHAFTQDVLLSETSKIVEEELWQAVKGLEEIIMVLEDMASQFERSGQTEKAEQLTCKAQEVKKRSAVLRDYIFRQDSNGIDQVNSIKNNMDINP